jgi:hypothetical protein
MQEIPKKNPLCSFLIAQRNSVTRVSLLSCSTTRKYLEFSTSFQMLSGSGSSLAPLPHVPPVFLDPRRRHQTGPHHRTRPRINLRPPIPPLVRPYQRAPNRRPKKPRKCHNTKRHPQPRPRLPHIICQTRNRGRKETLKSRGKQAVETSENVETGTSGDGEPSEEDEGVEEDDGEEGVEDS